MASMSLPLFFIFHFTTIQATCAVDTATLCVNPVTEEGFGNITNRYAWAMQSFKDSIYVSTLNVINIPRGLYAFARGEVFESYGTQIFKGDANTTETSWEWTEIVSGGMGDVRNYGVRKFVVAGDYMYGVTGNHKYGFEIWRTKGVEGQHGGFESVMKGGFGDINTTSGRGMGVFDGYLYIGAENRESGAKMYRRQINHNGDFTPKSEWETLSDDGFGDRNNIWFSEMIEFKGYLYVGTLNEDGMQLWRSENGKTFENVFKNGNGIKANKAAMKLTVYRGRLYIGTMNFVKGASLWMNEDSEGTSFIPVFEDGNGNRWNVYVWNMKAFNDRLYIGTLDLSEDGYGIPGFDLFSTMEAMPNSNDWITETMNGFDHPNQYGVRTFEVTEDGKTLMIGSATDKADHGCLVFEATVMK